MPLFFLELSLKLSLLLFVVWAILTFAIALTDTLEAFASYGLHAAGQVTYTFVYLVWEGLFTKDDSNLMVPVTMFLLMFFALASVFGWMLKLAFEDVYRQRRRR
jgi:hypothetical protein